MGLVMIIIIQILLARTQLGGRIRSHLLRLPAIFTNTRHSTMGYLGTQGLCVFVSEKLFGFTRLPDLDIISAGPAMQTTPRIFQLLRTSCS